MRRLSPIAALAALSCAACLHDPAKAVESWYGLARATCGPADGPAVELSIDTLPYAACSSSHEGQVRYYGGYVTFDSLRAGFTDSVRTAHICEKCPGTDSTVETLWLQVVSADSAAILVDFRHRRTGYVSKSGRVLLKACREKPGPFCG